MNDVGWTSLFGKGRWLTAMNRHETCESSGGTTGRGEVGSPVSALDSHQLIGYSFLCRLLNNRITVPPDLQSAEHHTLSPISCHRCYSRHEVWELERGRNTDYRGEAGEKGRERVSKKLRHDQNTDRGAGHLRTSGQRSYLKASFHSR